MLTRIFSCCLHRFGLRRQKAVSSRCPILQSQHRSSVDRRREPVNGTVLLAQSRIVVDQCRAAKLRRRDDGRRLFRRRRRQRDSTRFRPDLRRRIAHRRRRRS